MPRNTTLETIINSGAVPVAYRVLSVDMDWPEPYSEPPFSGGSRVSVPAVGTPAEYDADSFNAAAWTDVTALITGYRYASSLDQACGALSLGVAAGWSDTDLDRVFRAMRAIIVQERYSHQGQDTDWINICWCISTGYATEWQAGGGRQMTVNALDALMLAGLDVLGSEDGSALYQADLVAVGEYSDHYDMPLVAIATDAWEFGVTDWPGGPHADPQSTSVSSGHLVDSGASFTAAVVGKTVTAVKEGGNQTAIITARNSGTDLTLDTNIFDATNIPYYIGGIQPNWADRPGPQAWIHNVPDTDIEVPASKGGEAVQALHGEGVLRIGKTWATTEPGDPADFGEGLGYVDTIPDARCVLYRFAHPAGYSDRDGIELPDDTANGLEQIADPIVAGEVTVDGDYSALPQGLTIVLEDGSGARYITSAHAVDGGDTTFTLIDSAAEIATGTPLRYGQVNRAEDIVRQWLFEVGFHSDVSDPALFAAAPEQPELAGSGIPIILPPLTYDERDGQRRLDAIIDLRHNHAVLPNWLTITDPSGRIDTKNVTQVFDDASGPAAAVLPLPEAYINRAAIDRTDMNIYTRVVARGRYRQVGMPSDPNLHPGVTIEDVAEADGGLPTVNGSKQVTVGGVTYTLHSQVLRTGSGTNEDYVFPLENILRRDTPISTSGKKLRPWGWFYETPENNNAGVEASRALRNSWCGKALGEITLEEPVRIAKLEIHAPNTWWSDTNDWGGNNHNKDVILFPPIFAGKLRAHADGARIRVDYWDYALLAWMPLTDQLYLPVDIDALIEVETDQFATRAEVETDKLRIVCVEPFWAEHDDFNDDGFRVTIGCYMFGFRVFSIDEIRGVAEVGVDAPFTGAAWAAARARFRRRTYVVPEVADWAETQTDVDALALEWLRHVTRNLAPRPIVAIRPDAVVGDTVRMALPVSELVEYGDGSNQLSGWELDGLALDNSDELVLYWSLSNSGTTRTVNLYSDSARTVLVTGGSRTGDGAITMTAQGGSRLSGSVTVAYTGNDTGTVGAPTYLIVSKEHSGQAGEPGAQRFSVVNYLDPYFGVD